MMNIIKTTIGIFILAHTSQIHSSAEINTFAFETPNRNNAIYLSSFGISYDTSFSFKVKACQEANIILQTRNPENTFRVIHGAWDNTMSILLKNSNEMDVQHGTFLSCDVYRTFWISWETSGLRFGQGEVGNNPILTWNSAEELEIADIGVYTYWDQRGHWKLNITTGGWGSWYSDGDCSVTCGTGVRRYKRHCSDPLPGNFVTNCVGNTEELRECQNQGCHGGWSNWTEIGVCSTTCGIGTQMHGRICNQPVPGDNGSFCSGEHFALIHCFLDDCSGNWGPWQAIQFCSVSCGMGNQLRTRQCDNPPPSDGGSLCSGDNTSTVPCLLQDCPVSKWSYFKDLNITKAEEKEAMKDELKEIKAKIAVDPKNTTSAIRRRTSAHDKRPSAATVGYVGAMLLAIPVGLLVGCDCLRLGQTSKGKRT